MRVHWRGDGGEPVMRAPASRRGASRLTRATRCSAATRSIDLGLVRLDEPLPARFCAGRRCAGRIAPGGERRSGGLRADDAQRPEVRRRDARAPRSPRVEPYGAEHDPAVGLGRRAGVCPATPAARMIDGAGAVVAVIAWGGTGRARPAAAESRRACSSAPQRAWIDSTLAGWGASARAGE